jgi:hypothetical protein
MLGQGLFARATPDMTACGHGTWGQNTFNNSINSIGKNREMT